MLKVSRIICALTVMLCACSGASAQNVNYPAMDIEFTPENSQPGQDILKIKQPQSSTGVSKWNTVSVRVPGRLAYSPDIVVTGKASLEAQEAPNHLGLILVLSDGKQMFAKAPLKPGAPTSFSIKLSDFKGSDSPKNPEPPTLKI